MLAVIISMLGCTTVVMVPFLVRERMRRKEEQERRGDPPGTLWQRHDARRDWQEMNDALPSVEPVQAMPIVDAGAMRKPEPKAAALELPNAAATPEIESLPPSALAASLPPSGYEESLPAAGMANSLPPSRTEATDEEDDSTEV